MFDTALLVITGRSIVRIKDHLQAAAKTVQHKLYVRVEHSEFHTLVPQLYMQSSLYCPHLDVRVLLSDRIPEHQQIIGDDEPGEMTIPAKLYGTVVLGGTFDRLHNGHKTLLSRAILLCQKKMYCGVTDVAMIQKKSLWELIAPVDERIHDVEEFVNDVSDGLTLDLFPLDDPFGKAITEKDIDAIIVSEETLRGGEAVNKKRQERSMRSLTIDKIALLEADDKILNEIKISSSTRRREALGALLRAPFHAPRTNSPYIIGFTGGIASGKSNIAKYLRDLSDFEVIDCDKLAHAAYAPGSDLCKKLGAAFVGVLGENGVIDRRKLGTIVFGDPEKLLQLNSIVWPEVMKLVKERIAESTKPYIIVEAAALIEANWHREMNELWTVFVPRDEAQRRVCERDGYTEDEAKRRIDAQLTNKQRVDESNVVFCSLWAYEETKAQVLRAVDALRQRTKA